MPYILQHTAEAIDRKLSLIDENKNLLLYPYATSLPTGFSDVGDGSILTLIKTEADVTILLNTCILTAGKKYAFSVSITDIADVDATEEVDIGCTLKITADDNRIVETTTTGYLDLATATGDTNGHISATVELTIPANFKKGLVIKPQIEEVKEDKPIAVWVPNMDKISTYVDRRFSGINTRFAEVIQANSIKVGDVTLTDEQLTKILNFIDCFEFGTNN